MQFVAHGQLLSLLVQVLFTAKLSSPCPSNDCSADSTGSLQLQSVPEKVTDKSNFQQSCNFVRRRNERVSPKLVLAIYIYI